MSAGLIGAVAAPSLANINGTIDANITLEAGCVINGQSHDDGSSAADFGSLNFGSHNTLFTQADGQVMNGGSAFEIQCSSGIAPVLTFNAGQNDGEGAGAGLRAMANQAQAGQYVTYNLYSDAGRSTVIPIGDSITLASTGALQTVNVYGRAFGEAGLLPGAYSDVITVTLEL
ncbi:spore coat protein U-like protein [Sphingobium sp. B11D3B]|nr:spore coat U domain-containing protein [Sphingobium sp. B11D3B]MCW2389222.1 spore coat protein U-like protein [Sphingobium sp. B11D3B]